MMINMDDLGMLDELEAFAKEINGNKNAESKKCTTCKTCTCDNKNKENKKMNFDVNVFRTFNHKPMVIYGRIYSDATVLKVTNDTITVLINDLDDDWLDSTIIASSTKSFTLPVVEYGNYPGNKVTVENYFNFWMPLAEFMCVGIKNAADVNNVPMPKNKEVYKIAKRIWAIAGESPEIGNMLMDLIGEGAYNRVMKLANANNISDIPKKFKFTKLNSVPKTEYNSSSFVNKYDNNNISKIAKKVDVKKNTENREKKKAEADNIYLSQFKRSVNSLVIPDMIKDIIKCHKTTYAYKVWDNVPFYLYNTKTKIQAEVFFSGFDARNETLRFVNKTNTKIYTISIQDIALGIYTLRDKPIETEPSKKSVKTFDEYMNEKRKSNSGIRQVRDFTEFAKEIKKAMESDEDTAIAFNMGDADFDLNDILNIFANLNNDNEN